ncbi:NAD(P)-dependent dehydrogenase (short-subunit alcohol dehydrogenase family) [Sphingomonas naasensis]|uniref:SDR family NAD(P)-dependent oxidoreductase n=1 Tax=Sphingomonas naasensis TaxID=1344951 RepID=A0A4S1W4V1_9SPHN|nr:SDR family NAD(P)-dependent oxidoreductase [Sphingomonas naasensis]NIJ20668.1 NAD(P)-dependent dehydrogenase (short-subunit alcohol dehydrogenase family) [Sphingomonas naasensis]TGX37608.1 SDR family NAD(P)-dependent oxidoreductase [Sphingomonas naasensis]
MPRTWLVTGSSRGFGRALCERILEAGDNLLATARDLGQLASFVGSRPDQLAIARLDVTSEVDARAAVEAAIDRFGALDVLVNNAGYGDVGSVEDTTIDSFRRQIETNLFGTIILTKAAIPHMRARGSGHIIQFSSVGGRLGAPGRAPYSAAKWGVEGFSEVLAQEMRLIGVKVTIIEPGGFRTDFAGASTTLDAGRPEYDEVVGKTARMQRAYSGRQPGDPRRGAQAILDVVAATDPPLRLALGSDAVAAIERSDRARLDELTRWRSLSISTDYPASPDG